VVVAGDGASVAAVVVVRGFKLVTEAICAGAVLDVSLLLQHLLSELVLELEQHSLLFDLLLGVFLDIEQHEVLSDLLPLVFDDDEAVLYELAVVFVAVGVVQAFVAAVRLLVRASKLVIGENMRKAFSNIDMFCLLISSSVEPKGNMLPSEVWK